MKTVSYNCVGMMTKSYEVAQIFKAKTGATPKVMFTEIVEPMSDAEKASRDRRLKKMGIK